MFLAGLIVGELLIVVVVMVVLIVVVLVFGVIGGYGVAGLLGGLLVATMLKDLAASWRLDFGSARCFPEDEAIGI